MSVFLIVHFPNSSPRGYKTTMPSERCVIEIHLTRETAVKSVTARMECEPNSEGVWKNTTCSMFILERKANVVLPLEDFAQIIL